MRPLLLALMLFGLSGCTGVLDMCPDGLRPPPMGGWDQHGPA